MSDTTLPSGSILSITRAEFDDAMALHDAVLLHADKLPVTPDLMGMDISVFKDAVSSLARSPEVRSALFKCFQRVTYDGVKLTKELFNDPKGELRLKGDYYFICWEVMKENLGPFFVPIFSMFKDRIAIPPATPKP